MAVCLIVENPDQSPDQAQEVIAHVRTTGPVPPEGARLVMGGPANPGWRMISVWDSEEAIERVFGGRLVPAFKAVGLSLDGFERTVFPLYALVAGDLTGAPQPA